MTSRSALVLGLLVACSGDHYHGVDAPPLDAPTDTLGQIVGQPPPDAVAVHVTQLGQPVANVAVYFQTPASVVELAGTTDASGVAWALANDGDFVTVIEPANASGATAISTFAGVRKGDRLELALQPVTAGGSSVTLHVPVQAGALNYQIHDPCGDAIAVDATGVGPVTFTCGVGTTDLVIVPTDVNGSPAFGALYAANVAVARGGSVVIGGAYASFDTTTFTYSSVPAAVSYLNTYEAIVTPRGRVYDATDSAAPASGSGTTTIKMPQTPGGTTALTVTNVVPIDSETSQQSVFEWKPWTASYTLDLTAQRLPSYAGAPGFDLATTRVTWAENQGGAAPSFVRADLNLYRDAIPAGRRWTWRIAAPRTGTAVAIPHLPVDAFDFNPAGTDVVTVAELTNALVPGGYDAVRARAFDVLQQVISAPTGMMIVETTYSPPL